MKTKELRSLSAIELDVRKKQLKEEMFHLRIQKATGQLEKKHLTREIRKEIARIETVLTERQSESQALKQDIPLPTK